MTDEETIKKFYERRDSIKETIKNLDRIIEEDTELLNILQENSKNTTNKTITEFIEASLKNVDGYKDQKKHLTQYLDMSNELLVDYENDKNRYGEFFAKVLRACGIDPINDFDSEEDQNNI